ncbi:MAG: TIM barrel protein, partial [Saprospiraceae bacterium]
GVKNLIVLSGQRQGRTDYQNLINCKNGIRRIIGMAEDNGITISMEYLNSKVDHPDHQFDNMEWGVALCEMIDSPNFKILYDIYHAQIMEGDVVATIRKYHEYIAHYHTAGVPGRNEIDETQELNYRFIMEEIKKTGYTGFIGQEFIPSGKTQAERLGALKKAVQICDV